MESTLLQVGAIIFLAFLMILVMNFQILSSQFTNSYFTDVSNHAISETMRLLLRMEIQSVGENLRKGISAIKYFSPSVLSFYSDSDENGQTDETTIFLPTVQTLGTQANEDSYQIERIVKDYNGVREQIGYIGVHSLEFIYFDKNGVPTSNKNEITFIGFKMIIRAPERVRDEFQTITIEDRILPKGLWKF